MKKIFTLLALTISFSMNSQMTDNSNATTATEAGSVAMGIGTTASGYASIATGRETTASGYASTALGRETTASGYAATAIGQLTTASGTRSTAMGGYTTASGYTSTAMGQFTTASGDYSTAMGNATTASDHSSIVIGQYNSSGSSVTNSANEFDTANTAFVIGNGVAANNRSDALTVLFDGTTNVAGSVTATSFIGDGSQLTNLASSSPFSFNDVSGTGIQSGISTASGDYSTAMGNATTASGGFSTAMGRTTTASGGYSTSMGGYTIASGGYSTAMGYGSIASGSYSTAMGYDTRASGSDSTAMGFLTEASGDFSTAMGYYTIASGYTSTAMGINTKASDRSSLVIGEYNLLGSTVTNSATVFSTDNTAFVIGNGTDADNRSDALTVLFDGTTNVAGSVTATSFIGDGSQLTNLASSSPFSFNDVSGTGIQSGINTASGGDSIAMGFYSVASGQTSTATGLATIASGGSSTAMGGFTTASGYASTAMGADTVASGMMSTAMGFLTTASDYSSLVIGRFNSLGSTVTNSADQFNIENTAFVIGNGLAADNRSDAFSVMFNGDATLAGNLSVNSDAKLKSNIVSLGSTLAKLLQIDGKTYIMKKDENKKQKIGVLAQDIEKVFPELVSESNGVKSVNYQGLVPVLINALKEQQTEIDELKEQETKYMEQEQRLERLERLVANMD